MKEISRNTESDVEIIASGNALKTAAKWLGIVDVDAVLKVAKDDPSGPTTSLRIPQQGLGAKYLPHNKAVNLTTGVQKQLGNKIKKSAEKFEVAKRKHFEENEDEGDSQDLDEGRGTAFGGGKSSGTVYSRAELLASAPSQKGKRKTRKK